MARFSTDDTIVAIATPFGRGGIGVVRLSGIRASGIACALTGRTKAFPLRHATFTRVLDPADPGRPAVDQTVVTRFAAPHSYTGEDVVEISGHGSPVLLARVVGLCVQAGARLAEPGEFTLRAYLNGRLDLVQAEAVADVVDAVTPLQARVAMDQLEGTLTGAIGRVDAALLDLTARLEASLDFPEEGFHFITREETRAGVTRISADLDDLARSGRRGRLLREGRVVVISGPPNAGKSSLFNALVGSARAIVTDVPGTTRDVLTERVDIDGVPLTLVDTAGMREAGDAIEAEGIARARQARQVAALTLVVLDGSAPLNEGVREVLAETPLPRIAVINKGDLVRNWRTGDLGPGIVTVEVSAVRGDGLDALRRRLLADLGEQEPARDAPAISNARHLALVEEARAALDRAACELDAGATEELVLIELGAARHALEVITGRRTPDDLLVHIFSRFCVGK